MPYQIKVDVFEGPFDLLLYLIKKNELDIYNVSLAEITSQYLEYIRVMQQMDLEVAGEFLVIAATLIYIKTQRMLPQPTNPEELEELEQTEADILAKLQEYQKFKLFGGNLWELAEQRQLIYTRNDALPEIEDPSDVPVNATLTDLMLAMKKISRFMTKTSVREVAYEEFTVEMKIDHLHDILKTRDLILFSRLREDFKSRLELVVTFLAMLELTRLKHLSVNQPEVFGEIFISKRIHDNTIIEEAVVPESTTGEPASTAVLTIVEEAPETGDNPVPDNHSDQE